MPPGALLVIDMLNTYDHEDGDALAQSVRDKLPGIVRLRERAEAAPDTMVVYVNDIFGDWTLSRPELVDRALAGRQPDVVEPIAPRGPVPGDRPPAGPHPASGEPTPPREPVPFIPKGRHSIFYETALDHLLRE